jgi:hypothetical protein
MQFTLQLTPQVALALQRKRFADADVQTLLHLVQQAGFALSPMHPGSFDPALQSYYIVDAPDTAQNRDAIERIRACAGVEAAYVKPPDAQP